jgi:uncharacterized protein YkwD
VIAFALMLVPSATGGAAAQTTTTTTTTTTTLPGSRDCWIHTPGEKGLTTLINGARAAAGATPLNLDKHLSNAARLHTQEMVSTAQLFHTSDAKLAGRVTRWTVLGENVGVGSTVESLHQAFMNSPAHKANVLYSPYTYVGVGVVEDGGRTWVTIIFEGARNPGTRLPMPTC